MKYPNLILAIACVAAGALLLSQDSEAPKVQPSLISATALRERIASKADWYASFPKNTTAGIAMGCDMPIALARSYNRRLGETFTSQTLESFRADCKG